jgi:hypothetical protein
MSDKINIVCWKWNPVNKNAPNTKKKSAYSAYHVNALYQMLKDNTTLQFRLICVTDDLKGLHRSIEVVPLWDDFRELGACFTRLVCFQKDFDLFGKRFFSIDLDCVITGNIDHILTRTEPFLIWSPEENDLSRRSVDYCGSIFAMDVGAQCQVYDTFDPSLLRLNRHGRYSGGSDQKQISKKAQNVITLGQKDGIYNFMPDVQPLGKVLPKDCCIVFFNGLYMPDDPIIANEFPWVRKFYPAVARGEKRYDPEMIRRRRNRMVDQKQKSITYVLYWWENWPDGKHSTGLSYIRKMVKSLRRHTPKEIDHKIVLFTDKPDLRIADVIVRPLSIPVNFRWNLKKMYMYSTYANLVGPVLCFDLDCVIVNSLELLIKKVWKIENKLLITCAGAYRKRRLGGSVIGFKPKRKLERLLWEPLLTDLQSIETITKGSEREYLQRKLKRNQVLTWDSILPGKVLSYKRDCKEGLTEGASVVRFHGLPRPHEVNDDWVNQNWR